MNDPHTSSKNKNQRIDQLLDTLASTMASVDSEIKRVEDPSNPFYDMMGKKMLGMSSETQEWMEAEVWKLYGKALKRERGEQETTEPRNVFEVLMQCQNKIQFYNLFVSCYSIL